MSRLMLACAGASLGLIVACSGGTGLLGQTSVAIDVKFSRTARDPAYLGRTTEEITLAITGEGLSRPIETSLAPVAQTVAMQLPPGFKDFTAQAWRGNQLLAQGEAGALMETGRQTAIILNLVPISDPPAGTSGFGLPGGYGQPSQSGQVSSVGAPVAGPSAGPSAGPGSSAPALQLIMVPGAWPSPVGRS